MPEPVPPQQPDEPNEPNFTPEQIAEMRRRARAPGPVYSGQQIMDRLRAWEEEWQRTGGFDAEYLKAFRARQDEDDPPHYVVRARST
jgi:hypothetical protein